MTDGTIGAPHGVRRMRNARGARSARSAWSVALVAGAAVACHGVRDASTTAAGAPGAGQMAPSARDTGRDCGLVRVNAYPDPGVLVQAYVQRDGAGDFVQHVAWLDTAYECPHQLSGTRGFAVVAFRSAVAPLDHADSSARYTVQSEQLGAVTPDTGGAGYVVQRDTKVDTAVVVHTAFGWRLVAPMPPTNVLVAEILGAQSRFRLKAAARTTLAKQWAEAVSGTGN